MRCFYCGFEHTEPFAFCPNCGTDNRYSVPVNGAAYSILPALKSNLFLVICILLSASCGLYLISGSPSVITVLFTIFLWLIYGKSRNNIVDSKQLKNVSGTVFAGYIINYVLGGLMILIGLLFGLIFLLVDSIPEFYSAFMDGFEEGFEASGMTMYEFEAMLDEFGINFENFAFAIGILFFIVFTVIGVAMIVINALGMGKIHRLAKSAYKSVENGYLNLEKVTAAKNWLFVFGSCSAVSSLTTLTSGEFLAAIAGGADAAAMIIAGVLINKFLVSAVQPQQNVVH